MKKFFIQNIILLSISLFIYSPLVLAEIAFTGASNPSASLFTTLDGDDGNKVFVFKGLTEGESSSFTFSINTDCPMVALSGGAKFDSNWSCTAGVITTSVTYKGGMSFGPASDQTAGSFYLTFNNPPTPAGLTSPPTELSGIQISLYGDISQWNLSGEQTTSGVAFGIELTGSQGGESHFSMYLPPNAVTFLGSIIGVTVGGKSDPFATVTSNNDGSATIAVDIDSLQSNSLLLARLKTKADKAITKKILAGQRTLSLASKTKTVKSGGSINLAMCAGKDYSSGDKIPLQFLVAGKTNKSIKASSFTLDSKGCSSKKIKLPKNLRGTLVTKISYKGKKASTSTAIKP